jgi:hypothetical protein
MLTVIKLIHYIYNYNYKGRNIYNDCNLEKSLWL